MSVLRKEKMHLTLISFLVVKNRDVDVSLHLCVVPVDRLPTGITLCVCVLFTLSYKQSKVTFKVT